MTRKLLVYMILINLQWQFINKINNIMIKCLKLKEHFCNVLRFLHIFCCSKLYTLVQLYILNYIVWKIKYFVNMQIKKEKHLFRNIESRMYYSGCHLRKLKNSETAKIKLIIKKKNAFFMKMKFLEYFTMYTMNNLNFCVV